MGRVGGPVSGLGPTAGALAGALALGLGACAERTMGWGADSGSDSDTGAGSEGDGDGDGDGEEESDGDGDGDGVPCPEDQRVEDMGCVPCPPGTTNDPGDDPDGPDTSCERLRCDVDERVESNACVPCSPGTTNPPGDDATGADTFCLDTCFPALGVTCELFHEAYVKASNTDARDLFGHAVAVSGELMAVSAVDEKSQASGIDGDQYDDGWSALGAVYLFARDASGAWKQEAYIKSPSPSRDERFGAALSLDGGRLAVGAYGEGSAATGIDGDHTNEGANKSGAVYLFVRDPGGAWSREAYIKASNTGTDDRFGWSVSLDGDRLAVGALAEGSAATGIDGDQDDNNASRSGAAYVFVRAASGLWSQEAYIKASNAGPGDEFGGAVSLSGDRLAVGARLEASAAQGVDGDQLDNSLGGSGAVYLFSREGGAGWVQEAYLKASNTGQGDQFGFAVSLSGELLAVGAWLEDSDAEGVDGDQDANAAPDSGAVYLFTRDGGAWSQEAYIKASNTGALDTFGRSVSLRGAWLAVGAPGEDGASTLVDQDGGSDAAVNSGAVYLFGRDGGAAWSQVAYLKASNTDAGDQFGHAVAMSGPRLAVGAPGEDSAATGIDGDQLDNSLSNSGAAYLRRIAP